MTKNNIGRIQLYFNLKDPEEKEIYNAISKRRNMSEYIKQAVKHYVKGADISPFLEEKIKEVVRTTIREEMRNEENVVVREPEAKKIGVTKQKSKVKPKEILNESQDDEFVKLNMDGLDEMFG